MKLISDRARDEVRELARVVAYRVGECERYHTEIANLCNVLSQYSSDVDEKEDFVLMAKAHMRMRDESSVTLFRVFDNLGLPRPNAEMTDESDQTR